MTQSYIELRTRNSEARAPQRSVSGTLYKAVQAVHRFCVRPPASLYTGCACAMRGVVCTRYGTFSLLYPACTGDVYNYTPYHINHLKGGSTGLIKEDCGFWCVSTR